MNKVNRRMFMWIAVFLIAGIMLAAAQGSKPEKVRDPVCGLMVVKNPELSATYNGETYYFCSKTDRDKFTENPEKYVKTRK